MFRKLKFTPRYFGLSILLFASEVCIALFFHDKFIRPYMGDVLVVVLIYCFIKSFFDVAVLPTVIAVLIFSCFIEMLQYFNLVQMLGLQNFKLARIIIGTSFAWEDILAYIAGVAIVLFFEKRSTY